jgi:hypothetical protein
MKAALISPEEFVYSYDGTYLGKRVAQVEPAANVFPVAEPLFWVSCADDVVQDRFYWNGNTCVAIPIPLQIEAQQSAIVSIGNGGPNVLA